MKSFIKIETTIKSMLDSLLKSMLKLTVINEKEIDIIKYFLIKNTEYNFIKKEKIEIINKRYINNEIDFYEYLELLRKEKCYETPIYPEGEKKIIDKLILEGILQEKKDGISVEEPYYNVPYNLLSYRKPRKNISETVIKQSKFKTWLYSNIFGIITPLEDRKKLTSEIAYNVSTEPVILLSSTPSIFNPYELEENFPNHTKYFLKMIKESNNQIFYTWNLESIINQIKNHLKQNRISLGKLKRKYFKHLSNYVDNNKLFITCGECKNFDSKWKEIPFISQKYIIKAERINGKINNGIVMNLSKFAKIPKVFGKIGELLSLQTEHNLNKFDLIRRKIINDINSIRLEDTDRKSIENFIEKIFEKIN